MAFSLKIQGKDFENFNNFSLTLSFDSIASTFSFDAKFNPDNAEHRNLFRPFSYRKCEVFGDDELLLTGVILNHKFSQKPAKTLTSISGYSVTGVLEDSSIPVEKYPLETNNKTLLEIAQDLCNPFGLTVVSNTNDTATVIESTTAKMGESIKSYLSNLCSQRNLILTHDNIGRLVITKVPSSQKAITTLENSEVELSCNGQNMHSVITVMKQASIDTDNAGEATIQNPFISAFQTSITPSNPFVPNLRPLVKEQNSGNDNTTEQAAKTALANELKALKFTIPINSWYINKSLIKPSQIIKVTAPDCFLYKPTELFIESVTFTGSPESQKAVLSCSLPEVYNNNVPKNIFLP